MNASRTLSYTGEFPYALLHGRIPVFSALIRHGIQKANAIATGHRIIALCHRRRARWSASVLADGPFILRAVFTTNFLTIQLIDFGFFSHHFPQSTGPTSFFSVPDGPGVSERSVGSTPQLMEADLHWLIDIIITHTRTPHAPWQITPAIIIKSNIT